MNLPDTVPPRIDRVQKMALACGAVALILAIALGFTNWQQFFRSYLVAYVYWMVYAMGSLAILQLHHMTGGRWGYPIRRILEAGTRTIPVMTVLFVPVLFGMSRLYPWMQADSLGDDPAGGHLFRRLEFAGGIAEQVVGRAGSHGRSDPQGSHVESGCAGHGALGDYLVVGDD